MGEERKDSKLKQWHPMFLKSMRLALADAKPGQVEMYEKRKNYDAFSEVAAAVND